MNAPAVVCIDSFAGRIEHPCRIIGETSKRWRIEVDAPVKLPRSVLYPGETRLVPKSAVRVGG